jgi:ribosomal protein S12 methylthiotransferase accessory factor
MVRGVHVTTLTDAPFTPLETALERLEDAVSPLVGIVTSVVRTMHAPDETALPNQACEVASSRRTLGAPTVEYGSGAHPDLYRARAAAIGEALERYSGTYLPPDPLRIATARELGSAAVQPDRFALFHPAQHSNPQFRFVEFSETTRTHFVEGTSLADGARALLPAQLVYLRPPLPPLPRIGYATSSGLACAPTWTEAVLAALLELVERDAVILAWNNRLSLPQLDWSGDPRLARLAADFFQPTGLRFSVVDGSRFLGIPLAIAVVHGPAGSRASLAVGAACTAEVRDAWLKALSESFGVYRWLGLAAATERDRPLLEADAVQTFDDHMLYYARDERARLAEFLDASSAIMPVDRVPPLQGSTPREQLAAVVGQLERHGVSAYAVDVTAPDVRSLRLCVARVIAPELCPLDVSHTARFLGGRRLYTAAYRAGLVGAPLDFVDINPHPHPFP